MRKDAVESEATKDLLDVKVRTVAKVPGDVEDIKVLEVSLDLLDLKEIKE